MQSKEILVTGGAGYIGTACVAALVEEGYAVTVIDDLSTGQVDKIDSRARFKQVDITDQAAVVAVCQERSFDTVIHLAAKKAVGESEENPSLYFHTNVVGSYNLLAAMTEAQIPQIIFSSTAVVYNTPRTGELLSEETPTNPQNVYGTTKLMVENMIREYHRTGRLESYSVLRYFNVVGDAGLNYTEHNSPNIFPVLKRAVLDGTPVNIFGTDYDTRDGTCIRDYIHLADLVDAHVRAVSYQGSDVFNLGTGTGYTVRELIANFMSVSGKNIEAIESPRRAGDPAILLTSPAKANEILGWQPTNTLDNMVASIFVEE